MKKKQIEKLPYITLTKVSKRKDVRYIAVTEIKEIGGKGHLLLEVYRKDHMDVPVIRYVATERDWAVFRPATGKWSRNGITDMYGKVCWWTHEDQQTGGYIGDQKKNILHAPEDEERIRSFFPNIRIWKDENWWDYFYQHEMDIRCEEQKRKRQKRKERLQERIRNTPELREKELLEWSDGKLFGKMHTLFYRKKNSRATVCCSACGGVAEGRFKAGISYESQFEHCIKEPVDRQAGHCPLCGRLGTYCPQGKAGKVKEQSASVFLADRYMEKGVVLRYIRMYKEILLEEYAGESSTVEMYGAYEKLSVIEITRTYFLPGKKAQTDYHKHDPFLREDYWDDCNTAWSAGSIFTIGEAVVYPDTWDVLKGTFLQYCGMETYADQRGGVLNAKDYLERYINFPQIEMLSKIGLIGVVESMIKGYCGIVTDQSSRRVDKFLGIRQTRVKLLRENKGSLSMLDVLKMEYRLDQNWTENQIKALEELRIRDWENICEVLEVTTMQKMLNNIAHYAGCGYGTGCTEAKHRLRQTAITYLDYLHMRKQLGYDMSNTVYQKPRCLNAAHAKMVSEINKKEADKRIVEVEEKYHDIRRNYRRLRKEYFYQDNGFLIRPARSAGEIVIEGRALHHCVGGNGYLDNHDKGKRYILMLRRAEEPETPYITVEIDKQYHIIQWYGEHDSKPDAESMQQWLDGYTEWLKSPRQGTIAGTTQNMIAAAV